jgi:transposase
MHALADQAADVLRISMDAQAVVNVGPCARGGKSRSHGEATDHDCQPEAPVTPVGIVLPTLDALVVYGLTSKVTRACLVDRIVQWGETVRERFAHLTTLGITLDHGPEHHSRRTQVRQRLVEFGHQYPRGVRWAYSPPYPSKSKPIERGWGILENHWHGALLDSMEAVLGFTRTMTWHAVHPVVELVTTTYQTGVKLTKEAMARVEAQLQRLPHVEKWLVDIVSPLPTSWDT